MGLIAAGVLFGLVILRVALVALGASLILRPTHSCPACLDRTVLLHRPVLRAVLPWVEWRWCPLCGWQGPGRRVRPRRFVVRAATPVAPVEHNSSPTREVADGL